MLVVTGASGRYGRLLIDALIRRGIRPDALRATARNPSALTDLQARGVEVRKADFDQPDTLGPAFGGAATLMLVPTSAIGRRHEQMKAAIAAAVSVGVDRLAYAGFLNGDRNSFVLGEEHKQTEALIRQSAVRHVFLHNGPYIEPFVGELDDLPNSLDRGELIGSAGDGRLSGACRGDLAEAAAVALTSHLLGDVVYELGGTAFTMAEAAQAISTATGRPLAYKSVSMAEHSASLVEAGYPKPIADIAAEASFASRRGDWFTTSNDLPILLGRPSTPLLEVVRQTIARSRLGIAYEGRPSCH